MKLLAWRLVLTASLFVGWLGYLGYLVATRPLTAAGIPLVLSRPQIMISPIDIVADVSDDPDAPVVVVEILYPPDSSLQVGQKLTVLDLESCRPLPRRQNDKPPDDFTGAGRYLIPLRPSGREKGAYEVVPIPTSPGFDARRMENFGVRPVRIYPYNGESAAQYRRIEKPTVP
jgi:hypothetical protein